MLEENINPMLVGSQKNQQLGVFLKNEWSTKQTTPL